VPRVIYLFLPKIGFGGSKLLQLQNLGTILSFFFLGGQNRNFEKVRGLKLLLNLNKKKHSAFLLFQNSIVIWQ